jgi:hypothetical protein
MTVVTGYVRVMLSDVDENWEAKVAWLNDKANHIFKLGAACWFLSQSQFLSFVSTHKIVPGPPTDPATLFRQMREAYWKLHEHKLPRDGEEATDTQARIAADVEQKAKWDQRTEDLLDGRFPTDDPFLAFLTLRENT